MLDTEHGAPGARVEGDCNSYFLGRIGEHNVVIACLPAGQHGASSAATVAAQMQRTFRHLRIGLLVGVGSGAPSTTADIRLGDVVVSTPSGDTGGVIQYESTTAAAASTLSASCDGGSAWVVRSRCLNMPPFVLRTALSHLQAEHLLAGSRIRELLSHAAERYPQLRAKLAAPGSAASGSGSVGQAPMVAADRLFQAAYEHAGASGAVCDLCCDTRMCVARSDDERPSDGGPAVHYGVIASGALDLASGVARDRAREALGAICFEREAAGLMENFPCLVIRGVADYADSHKSARWRGYAAGTAAAFAKELLGFVPAQDIKRMPTILEATREGRWHSGPPRVPTIRYGNANVALIVHETVMRVERTVNTLAADEKSATSRATFSYHLNRLC
jgi:nucleoside phosphorylase